MRGREDVKSKVKYIIILLLIMLILLLGIVRVLKNRNTYDNRQREAVYIRPETLNPMFAEKFFLSYDGSVSKEDILNGLTDFVYYLVDNIQEINQLNEDDMLNLYNTNKEKFVKMGFSSQEDFVKIIALMKEIDKEKLELSYTAFELKTVEKKENKTSLVFSVKFVDVDVIGFKLQIENSNKNGEIIHISY